MRTTSRLVLGTLFLTFAASTPLMAQAGADNSRTNVRDNGLTEPTADQQSNGKTDVALTRKIRSAIVADKGLSTYAHNVKIITENGSVVLKGPVRSAAEKRKIEQIATNAAGNAVIDNEIDVTP